MISKTEELLNEILKGESLQEREQSWADFVKKHGYAIVSAPKSGKFHEIDHLIPDSYYVDEPQFYGWYEKLEGIEYQKVDPQEGFKRDGGKFINDIYGVEMDTYLDTPKNRKLVFDFISNNPECSIVNWHDTVYTNKKWQEYQDAFREVKDCHFFAEMIVNPLVNDIANMTGEQAHEKYDYIKDEIVCQTVEFPNGYSVQINVLIEEDDYRNSCEAVLLKDGKYVDQVDGDGLFGIWEIEDDNGNTYHVKVSPFDLINEKSNSIDMDSKQEMCQEFYADLYANSAKEDKMIEDLLQINGEEAREKYDLDRDFTITHTAQFKDGIEIDIKLCLADSESYNWCEAVIFKDGHEIGCSDVSGDYFGSWELEDHDGNKYCVNMHPFRDRVRDNTGVSKVSDSVLKSSKKEQANLAR